MSIGRVAKPVTCYIDCPWGTRDARELRDRPTRQASTLPLKSRETYPRARINLPRDTGQNSDANSTAAGGRRLKASLAAAMIALSANSANATHSGPAARLSSGSPIAGTAKPGG